MDWLKEVEKAGKEVLSILGGGYKEEVYEEALAHELRLKKIPYERQRNFEILYKGYHVSDGRADLIINPLWCSKGGKELVLELKAVKNIAESHIRQAQVYMVSLNINDGAVLSFSPDGEVLIEKVQKPVPTPVIDVCPPKRKGEKDIESVLKKSAEEVFTYFGREFIYQQYNKLFPEAIGVEIRLQGLDYSKGTYDLLYKGHKVFSYPFNFVFKDVVASVVTYRNEEKFNEEKDEFRYYVKTFGLTKGYLIGIPETEEGKVRVEAV